MKRPLLTITRSRQLSALCWIVLLLFGAKKLPEIGGGLGRAIRNFRRASSEPDEIDITPTKDKSVTTNTTNNGDGMPKA